MFCTDLQLHRLSDGAPCPGHGAKRRARRHPPAPRRVHPGPPRRRRPRPTATRRPTGGSRRQQCGAVAGAGRHRHPRPSSRLLRHRPRAEPRSRPSSAARCRAARSHDFAHLLLRFAGGARGSMWVTNSAAGAEHGLHLRVFGEKGGLEWHQEEPNRLLYRPLGGFAQVLTRGRPGPLARGRARDAHRARPPRRLSRGVRQSVCRRRRGDRRAADRRASPIRSRSTSRPSRTAPAG